MASRCSFGGLFFVICADLAVNAKKPLKYPWPGMALRGFGRSLVTQGRQGLFAEPLNRGRKRIGIVFARPIILSVEDQLVHCRAANSNDRRAARLAFQCDQAKSFLHAWMNKNVRRAVITSELARLRAVTNPGNILVSRL